MDVACRLSLEVDVRVRAISIDRSGRFDDLDVKAAGKGLEVRHDELSIPQDVRCGQHIVELGEAESNKNTDNPSIMAEVEIDVLVYRECAGVIVERDINLCRRIGNNVVLHTSEDFLYIACDMSECGIT